MEYCGLISTTNGQTLTQKWENGVVETPSEYLPNKRKRNDPSNMNGSAGGRCDSSESFSIKETSKRQSSFVMIDGQRGVYFSESWKPNGSTLYLPVSGSVLANMAKYDQISFEQGCFCIGDMTGRFQQKAQGQAIHCWRYNTEERKLFIAISYFFTNFQVFQDMVLTLESL